MARWIRRMVGGLGLGLVLALGAGCSIPSEDAEHGELELVVGPERAPYDVVGRFHLVGLEPYTLDRDVVFDGTLSRANVTLPAGRYALTLHAGASLACADEATDVAAALADAAPPAAARLVSAQPQQVAIASGERLTVRIALGAPPPGSSDEPCAPLLDAAISQR